MPDLAPTPAAPSLADKLAFLSRPASYPEPTARVERRETHMAYVFLTAQHAWKLKKPVRYPFLDYASLEAREHACREELRLNARLAEGVYLGVVPLCVDVAGGLRLGAGIVVDWLVWMRRLPEALMLDRMLAAGTVDAAAIQRLAARLAQFFKGAPPVAFPPGAYRERFAVELADIRAVLAEPGFAVGGQGVVASVGGFLDTAGDLLEARAAGGRIVEGHGDLRPEHVCLEAQPVIFDCLEFNRELRQLDPVEEIAFLGLECGLLGGGWIAPVALEAYAQATGDHPSPRLLAFYTAWRALLRAKLCCRHSLEPGERGPAHWLTRARAYLVAAENAAAAMA
jgi:aminoglycoside phosphotransferase family enzyme